MNRPSPVPGFAPPRVARGRTSRRSAAGRSAGCPGPRRRPRRSTRPSSAVARTSTSPPAGEYLTALSIRFSSTWRSRSRSPRTGGSAPCTLGGDAHLVLPELRGRRPPPRRSSAEVDVAEAVAERPGLDPRRVEHVADQLGEPSRLVADQREERLALLGASARASGPAASAPRRSPPPSGCAARGRRARRSPRAAPRAGAAPRRVCAPPRRRGCSAPRSRPAGRAARRARPPPARTHPRSVRTRPRSSRSCARRPAAARRRGCAGRARAAPPPPGYRSASSRRPVDDLALEHLARAPSRATGRAEPGGKTSSRPRPRSPSPRRGSPSTSTIAIRSKGTSPRSSRMKAPKASSSSSDEPSARAQRFAASSTSTRRPSSSRRPSASPARDRATASRGEPVDEPADDQPDHQEDADGNVTRSQMNAGPNSLARNHSTSARNGTERNGDRHRPRQAEADRALDHDEISAQRVGLPYSKEKSVDERGDHGSRRRRAAAMPTARRVRRPADQHETHDRADGEDAPSRSRPTPRSRTDSPVNAPTCEDREAGPPRDGPARSSARRRAAASAAQQARVPIRASAHRACSRSSSSSLVGVALGQRRPSPRRRRSRARRARCAAGSARRCAGTYSRS